MPRVNVLCVHAWVLRVRAGKSCMSLRAHAFHVGRHTCARAHICWRIGGKWDSSRFGHDDDCAVTGEKGEGFLRIIVHVYTCHLFGCMHKHFLASVRVMQDELY